MIDSKWQPDSDLELLLEEFISQVDAGAEPSPEEFAERLGSAKQRQEFLDLAARFRVIEEKWAVVGPPPDRIAGFAIEEELGRGGMGVVYSTRDSEGNPLALKTLTQETSLHPLLRARFQREMKLISNLQHPNIVQVLEFGEADSRPFLVMERLDGGTLEDRIRERRSDSQPRTDEEVREACCILLKISDAVSSAHEQGVLHRDIKPANILFDEHGEPRLADFGLARAQGASTLTTTGKVVGTPAYLAPERFLNPIAARNPRVDVYSLGVTLFEAITGARPFQGDLPNVLAASRRGPPPIQVFLGRSFGRELDAILERSVSHLPASRYRSAGDLANDLRSWLDGQPVKALRGLAWRRFRRTVARRPLVSIGLVMALLTVLYAGIKYIESEERQSIAEHHRRAGRREVDRLQSVVVDFEELLHVAPDIDSRTAEVDRAKRLVEVRAIAENALSEGALRLQSALVVAPSYEDAMQDLFALHRAAARFTQLDGRFFESETHWQAAWRYSDHPDAPLLLGSLQVDTEPSGADALLARYRWEEPDVPWELESTASESSLRTPFSLEELPPGSYLLRLRRPDGQRWIAYPFLLSRDETLEIRGLKLPPDEEIGEGWEFIPAGSFISGGDLNALGGSPRAIRYVDDFMMKVIEVSCAEYYEFLASILSDSRGCPHPDHEGDKRYDEYVHFPTNESLVPEEMREQLLTGAAVSAFGYTPDRSIHSIHGNDARHYVAWLNRFQAPTGDWEYALPTQWQWEKAARGVDGRHFPWGNQFRWEYAIHDFNEQLGSNQKRNDDTMIPNRIDTDRSPFGIVDMVGNVREFSSSETGFRNFRWICGGESNYFFEEQMRPAGRSGAALLHANYHFGIRLIKRRRQD